MPTAPRDNPSSINLCWRDFKRLGFRYLMRSMTFLAGLSPGLAGFTRWRRCRNASAACFAAAALANRPSLGGGGGFGGLGALFGPKAGAFAGLAIEGARAGALFGLSCSSLTGASFCTGAAGASSSSSSLTVIASARTRRAGVKMPAKAARRNSNGAALSRRDQSMRRKIINQTNTAGYHCDTVALVRRAALPRGGLASCKT